MKQTLTGLSLLASSLMFTCGAATTVQTFYFDFGPNNVANRGNITPADVADANGNFWNNIHSTSGNNITAQSEFNTIQNSSGTQAAGVSVLVDGQFNTNGLNGGGGLLEPSAELLGDLAVATATEDYMFLDGNNVDNRAFIVRGLNPEHAYTFRIFTSRKAADTRVGRFTIEGYNSFVGENQAAGSGIGANGENQNTSTVLVSDPVFPAANGSIKITVSRVSGAYIPVNCMSMTEEADVKRPEAVLSDCRYYFDFGATPNGANKCVLTESPDVNGNHWNNITNTSDGSKYAVAGSVFDGLVDSKGNATSMTITLNDRFSTNGMSGGGGLLSPDADKLGDLAIASATSDYYFYEADQSDCSMTIGGLDATKAYRFYIFASRSASDNRTGNYRLSGYNIWSGTLQAAGANIGGSGVNQNNSNILAGDYVFPDADGNIRLTIMRQSGTYIPLNCMKIEEFSGIDKPVINNFTSLSLGGNAIEGRKLQISREMIDGVPTGVFSGVADFAEGGFTLVATDENGNIHNLGRGDADGKLAEGGAAIAVSGVPALISFDLAGMTYELTPIENIRIIGSAVGAWSLTDYKQMTYAGDLLYTWQGELQGHDTSTDSGRVGLYINGGWTAFKRHHVDSDYNAVLALDNGDDIPLNPGCYSMSFDLASGVLKVENGADELDADRITVFGSSVANGQGAEQIENLNHGYMYLYGEQLAQRNSAGLSDNSFYISNISINGNSTVNLLNRYDDMRREFGKYVVFGVSLGNEGIHDAADKEAVYGRFRTNMQRLIDMVRADGKVPVVCNNYTRGDFTAEDYSYIVAMDREIGLWDVPSVNLLGAIDSKSGRWADGYQNGTDIYHPNQQGHQEFAYAMVPSLFDALESGKELCMARISADGMNMSRASLSAVPEGTMHSFALVAVLDGAIEDGNMASVRLDGSDITLDLAVSAGNLTVGIGDASAAVPCAVSEGRTLVAVSYTYASGVLDLSAYNGTALLGSARLEGLKLAPVEFTFGPSDVKLCEAMLYRSALTDADVESLAGGELHKSSLELYSVLNGDSDSVSLSVDGPVENHAMSLNSFTLTRSADTSVAAPEIGDEDSEAVYYGVDGVKTNTPDNGRIYIVAKNGKVSKAINK